MRISVSRSRAGASAFAVSNRSSASVHGPSFGRGWTSRSYENAVSPDRRIRRTVLRDRRRVREISLIDFPLPRCSRRIRPIVSTISIPHRPLRAKAGRRPNRKSGGQFWTPMTPLRGSILHAETHGRDPRVDGAAQPALRLLILHGARSPDDAQRGLLAAALSPALSALPGFSRRDSLSLPKPEEAMAVPVGPRHRPGDLGQAAEGPAIPGEALLEDHDPLKLALPLSN